ncbi:hypothetical protein MJO29_002131, partial [Puccinia striiformis f. sp. tritici]
MPAPEATSDRTAALKEENCHLKEDYDSIKWILQIVAMEKTGTPKNGSNPSTPKAKNPLKSVTPDKLKKETPDHDLDTRSRIEGFFDVCDTPPNDSAGSQIQQLEVWGLACHRFGLPAQHKASKINMDKHTLMKMYWRHCKSLRCYFQRRKKGVEQLVQDRVKNTARQSLNSVLTVPPPSTEHISNSGNQLPVNFTLNNKKSTPTLSSLKSNNELVVEDKVVVALAKTPFWRPPKATALIEWIERRRRTQKVIPVGLPQDSYSEAFLHTLSFASQKVLAMGPNLFDMIDNFDFIIPACKGNFHHYPEQAHIEYVAQANNESDDEGKGKVEFLANDNIEIKIEEVKKCFEIPRILFSSPISTKD